MMIQRAILHILDFYSDVSVFSEAEIDLSDEAAAGYISKQMEKLQNNPSGRRGGFSPDSEFLADLRRAELCGIFRTDSENSAPLLVTCRRRASRGRAFRRFLGGGQSFCGVFAAE